MTNIIEEIEKQQLRDDIPEFNPGDTVAVQVRIREGGHPGRWSRKIADI